MESRSYWLAASRMIILNWISLTFSPAGPLGPSKPWWQMERLIHKTPSAFILVRSGSKHGTKRMHWCLLPKLHDFLSLTLNPGVPGRPGFPESPWKDNIIQIKVQTPSQTKYIISWTHVNHKLKQHCCTHSLTSFTRWSSLPLQRNTCPYLLCWRRLVAE